MSDFKAEIERVKALADIASVIGNFVELRRTGVDFYGNCPFHDDRKRKMRVSPRRKTFTCFSCGEKGDVISFIQKHEDRKFKDAVIRVCDIEGITPPKL